MLQWKSAAWSGRKIRRNHFAGASVVAVALALVASAELQGSEPQALPVLVPVVVAANATFGGADEAAASAVNVLGAYVKNASTDGALLTAFKAYYRFRAANPEQVRNSYFYYVDLGLDNREARGFIFDMKKVRLVEGPFHVAHGRGSSPARNGIPTHFSNSAGSYASSLGLYVAGPTYQFSGKSGGKSYSSVGLRMFGESGAFNNAAERRGIVAHGAPYVTANAAGRSEGCPAMEMKRANRLLPLLANGGLVFLYSPNAQWLEGDPWVGSEADSKNRGHQ